ncbi:MAG: sulfite exporter TauE/SafE family protein [Azospirillaceae bacterium]
MIDIELSALLPLAGALVAAGAFAGVLAGLLGVGGGIVIVPALYHLFATIGIDDSVRMHVAVGTSLSTIIATSISSMRAHHRRGSVDWGLLKSWGPAVAVGVLVGTALAGAASADALEAVFGVVALLVALYMAFAPATLRLAQDLPRGLPKLGIGTVIGTLSAMMGIGGGSLTVPVLTLCGVDIRRAVGTASGVGLIIAVPGTIGFAVSGWGTPGLPPGSLGYVSVVGFAVLVPTTVLCAPLGARLAHTIPQPVLRRAFAAFLAITAIRLLIEA